MSIEYKETKTLIEVWVNGHRRGSIRRRAYGRSQGWYYRVTSCNFGPTYASVNHVKEFITSKVTA